MKLYKSDRIRFIFGLICIIIIYSWYYLFFITEDQSWMELPKLTFHLIRFGTTIVVYFIGTFHLGKLEDIWMDKVWHLVHIGGLIIITSMGLFDWFIMEIARNIKDIIHTIQELLISPVLYVGMGILNGALKRSKK